MWEAFKFKKAAPEEEPVAANDNMEQKESVAKTPQEEATEVLRSLLSPEAWTLWESLSLAPDYGAFEKTLGVLNQLSGSQLNYGDPVAGKRLEEEILNDRLMDTTINLGKYRVRVTRGMNGKFHFAAA